VNPNRVERDDLLDDARFWALLYEFWVKPRVGDSFDDGEQYFFSVRESAVGSFFHRLEGARTEHRHYPEYSVLLRLRNDWRIGVVLSMYPEDFEIQEVVAPPSADELIVLGVNGGHSRLPALCWEELLMLRDAVVPNNLAMKAKAVLLLFPSICLSSDMKIDEIRQVVEPAWTNSGIPVRHASELVGRPIDDFLGSRRLYPDVQETVWRKHRKHGWINDNPQSFRNPKVDGSERVIPVMRRLFSTLESERNSG
jgi:hypothetical protein